MNVNDGLGLLWWFLSLGFVLRALCLVPERFLSLPNG